MIIVLVFIILIFYSLFIPVIISLPLLLLLEINFSIYYLEYYDKITINTIIFYLFILTLKNYSNKKFLKKLFIYYFSITLIIALGIKVLIPEISNVIQGVIGAFIILIIFYVDVYYEKYSDIKQTIKHLNKYFYIFFILGASLLTFKYYLLLNRINPSFYFLFITVIISTLMFYSFFKGLKPTLTGKIINK